MCKLCTIVHIANIALWLVIKTYPGVVFLNKQIEFLSGNFQSTTKGEWQGQMVQLHMYIVFSLHLSAQTWPGKINARI